MTRPPRPSVADLRTTDVMLRCAAVVDGAGGLENRILAAELRLRATWIEHARVDPGVSEERRMAIAAVEDSPSKDSRGRS